MKRIYKMFFFLILLLLSFSYTHTLSNTIDDRPYLEVAQKAAEWVSNAAIETGSGFGWPETIGEAESANDLYAGTAGVVLFFLEAYYSTGNVDYLNTARAGADHLLSILDQEQNMGMYTGIAGISYALEETYQATKDNKYRNGVLECIDILNTNKDWMDKGVRWSSTTDIISGNAGIGLVLLYLAQELDNDTARQLAEEAGSYLLYVAIPVGDNYKWWVSPYWSSNQFMPNFSHGTAGISFFLARLYEQTGKKEYLDAAIKGATYLQSIAKTEGGICLICQVEGEKENTFALSWCHGPPGTARLFFQLFKVTGDKTWMEWVRRCANSILQSGFPDQPLEYGLGSLQQCCGAPGVVKFFLDLYWYTNDVVYLNYLNKVSDYVQERLINTDGSFRTSHFQNKVGFMSGAAGNGALFFHLDRFETGRKWNINLPDSPWLPLNRHDYCMKKLKVSKKTFSPGDNIEITAKIKNQGFEASPKIMVNLYLARKVKQPGVVPDVSQNLKSVRLKPLGAGKKARIKASCQIPEDSLKGKYYVVANVVPTAKNADLYKLNNYLTTKSKITIKKK